MMKAHRILNSNGSGQPVTATDVIQDEGRGHADPAQALKHPSLLGRRLGFIPGARGPVCAPGARVLAVALRVAHIVGSLELSPREAEQIPGKGRLDGCHSWPQEQSLPATRTQLAPCCRLCPKHNLFAERESRSGWISSARENRPRRLAT